MRTHCLNLGGQVHTTTATPAAGDDSRTLSELTVTCVRMKCDIDTPLPAAIDDLFEVMMFVKDLVDWQSLGLALGLLYPTLKRIEKEYNGNIGECKLEMLAAWLRQQDNVFHKGVPSWSVLQAALRRMGENQLADRLLICKCNSHVTS